MSEIQLSRLKNDQIELQEYIESVRSKGNTELASKLERKYDYLTNRITERMAS